MYTFYKTTPSPIDGHYHIVALDESSGVGIISEGSLDTEYSLQPHALQYLPPKEELRDDEGNLIQQAQQGGFSILGGSLDNHPHDIIPYVLKDLNKRTSQETDQEIIAEALNQFAVCEELEGDSLEKAKEAYRFRFGDQWDEKNKKLLESNNRPALTVNDIGQNVDELCGYQRQQRTDYHFMPIEDGDAKTADLLNIAVRVILDRCNYHREESKAFHDEVVAGRGWENLYISREKDIRGDIIVERFPYDQITAGEHEKEDLSDCEVIFKHKMYSLSKLKQMFPDKADEIEKDFDLFTNKVHTHEDSTRDAYEQGRATRATILSFGNKLVDLVKKEYRVMERWMKVYIPSAVAVDEKTSQVYNLFGWHKKDLALIDTMGPFSIIEHVVTKFRITRFCSGVLLSDDPVADLPVDAFHVVPFYCQKHGNMFRGKIEDVKDPQRIVNFQYSQLIDIVNKMVNYVYFYDHSTFPSKREKKKFLENASKPGSAFEVTDVTRRPVKEEGLEFPSGVAEVVRGASEKIKQLFNIQVYQGGANTSAEAILQRQKLQLTGNEFIFDNFSFGKKQMGRLIIANLREVYTPARLARIILNNNAGATAEAKVGGEPLSTYTEEDIISLLQNFEVEDYDVAITESGTSPTAKMEAYTLVRDIAQAGGQVPPEVLIELADIPANVKAIVQQKLQAAMEASSQSSQITAESEETKSLIGKGIIPPKVQAKLIQQAEELQLPRPNFAGIQGEQTNFENDIGNNAQIT